MCSKEDMFSCQGNHGYTPLLRSNWDAFVIFGLVFKLAVILFVWVGYYAPNSLDIDKFS